MRKLIPVVGPLLAAVVAMVPIVGAILAGVLAPLIAPFDPRAQNLSLLQGGCCPGPSGEHYFGVDDLGRDEFSRIVYGARVSLAVSLLSVLIAATVAVFAIVVPISPLQKAQNQDKVMVARSNLDVVVARSALGEHEAGLYAGGLIVTKAVLFLPQFAVVILFPAMSTHGESRSAVLRGLALLSALGAACVAGAWLLSDVALVFIGGQEYAAVADKLWLFALLGGLLSVLQLLVYAGLARRGRTTKYLIAVGVLLLVGAGAVADGVTGLAVTVAVIDAAVVALLVALQMFRHRREV